MNGSSNDIPCALCGAPIFSRDDFSRNSNSHPLTLARLNGGNNLWSSTLFRKSGSNPYSGSNPPTPHRSLSTDLPQVFIFRVASHPASIPIPSLPIPVSATPPPMSNSSSNSQSSTIYPLCRGSWCLTRLRTTCSLWSFVRTGIIEKIWEEEVPALPPPKISVQPETNKPPIPPRKRGLWGMASVLGERAASWGEAAMKMTPSPQLEQETTRKSSSEQFSHPSTPASPAVTASPSIPQRASNRIPGTSNLQKPDSDAAHPPPTVPRRSMERAPPSVTSSPTQSDSSPVIASSSSPDEATSLASKKEHATASPQIMPQALPQSVPSPAFEKDHATASPQIMPQPLSQAVPSPGPSPAPPTTAPTTSQAAPPIPARASGHKRQSATLPERIALPDSRPGTPLHGGPPSRTNSPAPGTGAPPPIPRRAAARTRLTNSGDAGSRPATPVNTAATGTTEAPAPSISIPAPVPEVETNVNAPDGAKTSSAVQREGMLDSLKLPEVAAARIEESPSPSTEEWKSVNVTPAGAGSPQEEAAPRLETTSPVPPSVSSTIEVTASTKGKAQQVQPSSSGSGIVSPSSQGEEEESLIPSDKSVFGSSKAASPFQSNWSIGGAGSDALSNSDRSAEGKEGEPKEAYVGDATWEERTWKELVRLREDMFWARIGGLR